MNWYKIRKFADGIWEDIEEHGPGGTSSPITSEIIKYKETHPNWTEEDIEFLKESLSLKPKQRNSHYGIHEFNRREDFVSDYSWSVPSKEAISKIKEFVGNDQIIEIAAGYGLWAKLLRDEDVDVIATDAFGEDFICFIPKDVRYTDIEKLNNEEAIDKYGHLPVLMMSWPPYNDPMAYNTISRFKGNKFIYIGEDSMGCTGGQDFHDALHREWEIVERICIPRWSGIYDSLILYQRN